jgi:hypothetical protein
VSPRPQPAQSPTRASYRWALRNWRRAHGGLAIAVVIGALSGSAVVLIVLVLFALLATAYVRSRP